MIRTLTTEQLREIMCVYGNTHPCYLAAAECLANREAQPVMWAHERKLSTDVAITKDAAVAAAWESEGLSVKPLYTAPPAPVPAVPEEITAPLGAIANGYQLSIAQAEGYRWGWNACRAAMLDRQNVDHVVDAAQKVEPVSQGCELPNAWIPSDERMPKDGDVVLVFQEGGIIFCAEVDDGEFYPDEFPRVPTQGREITHWMPLPAAPEVRRGDA